MNRQDIYCENCEGEFVVESTSLVPVSFCPNCGSEVEPETENYDDDYWSDDE